MNFDTIVEEYFETHAELLEKIKVFEQRRSLNLLRKLIRDKDEVNFFSWLAEVRFGLFFDQISETLKNECLIDAKTPDWAITMSGQTIIAEVLRLNTSEQEYREAIASNRRLRKFQKENPHVPLPIQGTVKTISLEHLAGNQSKLAKKEQRYRDVIQNNQFPFIICAAPTLETFLFELDFSDFLMGNRGFFRRDENFRRNVTGVLLNTPFDQFFYFHNEHAEFQLIGRNLDSFMPWLYKG